MFSEYVLTLNGAIQQTLVKLTCMLDCQKEVLHLARFVLKPNMLLILPSFVLQLDLVKLYCLIGECMSDLFSSLFSCVDVELSKHERQTFRAITPGACV